MGITLNENKGGTRMVSRRIVANEQSLEQI